MTEPCEPEGRRRARAVRAGAAASAVLLGLSILTAPSASAATVIEEESFTGAKVTDPAVWTSPNTPGAFQPCLTGATGNDTSVENGLSACPEGQRDPAGQGAFRLTDNTQRQSGVILLDEAFQSDRGVEMTFDMYQYAADGHGSARPGADGMAVFLIDGAQKSVKPGDVGGFLAYRNLTGAVLGVGFDQYGNFSNGPAWDQGMAVKGDKGPGTQPNSVVIRGRDNRADKPSKPSFQYVKGVKSPVPLAVDAAKTREKAKRTVQISVTREKLVTVGIDFNDGKKLRTVIDNFDVGANADGSRDELPPSLKLGFGAATGSSGAVHEISGFRLTGLDPDLTAAIKADPATLKGGQDATYQLDVQNQQVAAPTSKPITAAFEAPAGVVPAAASGTGWTCTIAGQKVDCTRSAALKPGQAAPPVTVTAKVTAAAAEQVTGKVTFSTADEGKDTLTDNTASVTSSVEKAATETALKVGIVSKPNPYVPGGVLSYTATVTNDGPADATGAVADVDWPVLMDESTWTCTATEGSSCPPSGRGDIAEAKIDVKAGGKVTIVVNCLLPITAKGEQKATAKVTAPEGVTDVNCKKTCTSEETNAGSVLTPLKEKAESATQPTSREETRTP